MPIMRALPVDLIAGWADVELIKIELGQRFQPVDDVLFAHGTGAAVATQATLKGFYLTE